MPRIRPIKLLFLPLIFFCFSTSGAGEFNITMKGDWLFHPSTINIQKGDTVVWINEDDSNHNVIFEDASIKSSENIKPGKEFSLTFDKQGEYKYYCRYHRDYDMRGVVIVK